MGHRHRLLAKKLTTRHDAPKTFAGRLEANLPLTTPDLPCGRLMRLRGLVLLNDGYGVLDGSPPDDADTATVDLSLGLVDVGDAL